MTMKKVAVKDREGNTIKEWKGEEIAEIADKIHRLCQLYDGHMVWIDEEPDFSPQSFEDVRYISVVDR